MTSGAGTEPVLIASNYSKRGEPIEIDVVLHKKLMRAAREPSRVFAASDTSDSRYPLWSLDLDGEVWYMPNRGAWAFPGADCPVLERAVERLGIEPLPLPFQEKCKAALREHLSAPVEYIWKAQTLRPELFELPVPDWIPRRGDKEPKATVLPGIRLPYYTEPRVIPGTPAYYVLRRFAKEWQDLEWHILKGKPVLRSVVEGRVVGLIALTIPGANREEVMTDAEDKAA